jgi:hypothetical protein
LPLYGRKGKRRVDEVLEAQPGATEHFVVCDLPGFADFAEQLPAEKQRVGREGARWWGGMTYRQSVTALRDVRQWRMVSWVPDGRNESVPKLGPGVTGRAVWHAHKITVIERRLVVWIVLRISPPRRRVSGRGCGGAPYTMTDASRASAIFIFALAS